MRTFIGSWPNRLAQCFFLIISCGVLYFGVAILMLKSSSSGMPPIVGSMLFFLLGGGVGAVSLVGLLESFTKYEMDSEAIKRRAWNGTQSMRWSDINSIEETGQRDGNLTFTDSLGYKLKVHPAHLGNTQQQELRELLEPRLAPLRERQQREVSLPGKVYYPTRNATWAGVVMVVIVGMLSIAFMFIPVPADQRGYFYAIMGILIVGGPLFGFLSVATYTNSLTFTEQAIQYRLWMRTNTLPFHKVTSVTSRMQSYKGSTWELTTVEGDGKKVVFTSKMPDYPVVLNFVKAHVQSAALEAGAVVAVAADKKQEQTARIARPAFALIYSVLFIGMGAWFIHHGNERLADYLLMDKEGQHTVGHVTGTHRGHSKSARYLLDYEFQAGEAKIVSSSPVSYEDYQRAQIGTPIRVVYVLSNPHICRAAQSTGRNSAEGDIRMGFINIVLGCILPPLLIVVPCLKKKKRGTEAVKAPISR